jgi:hypothetical protein
MRFLLIQRQALSRDIVVGSFRQAAVAIRIVTILGGAW